MGVERSALGRKHRKLPVFAVVELACICVWASLHAGRTCFVAPPAPFRRPLFSAVRGRFAAATPEGSEVELAKPDGYKYDPVRWLVDISVPDQALQDVLESVTDVDAVWPDSGRSLMREEFRENVKARNGGAAGSSDFVSSLFGGSASSQTVQKELDDRAIDSVFNTFSAASPVLTPESREKVAEAIKSWRPSPGVSVNTFAVQPGILAARFWIAGAWFFLNIFSAYAGYFVIGRPILYQLAGIDLLPGLKRWWEATS